MVGNILFICDQGRLRSRTASELVNNEFPQYEARFGGLDKDAQVPVDLVSIYWADIIVVMKPYQKNKLAKLFPSFRKEFGHVPVKCWHINDVHEYNAPRLKELIREGMYEFTHAGCSPPPRAYGGPDFSTPVSGGV